MKIQFENFKCCWRQCKKFKLYSESTKHSVVHFFFQPINFQIYLRKLSAFYFKLTFHRMGRKKTNYLPLHDQVNIFSNDERCGKVFGLFWYQCPNVYCFFINSFFSWWFHQFHVYFQSSFSTNFLPVYLFENPLFFMKHG